MKKIIAPSLLAADFAKLDLEIKRISKAGASWLHFDVMDGHFVPNISFGPVVLASVNKVSNLFLDVHLMITDPAKYVDEFIDAGADLISFHLEAVKSKDILKLIKYIKSKKIKVGIAVKPKTKIESVLPYLKLIDLVLVMSVEPGFGGQKFMIQAVEKIKVLKGYIKKNKLKTLIEVDGGINNESAKLCSQAGVDILVAGSYLFGHKDLKARLKKLAGG
jgi:ribulose-phosphate 3-epimerase